MTAEGKILAQVSNYAPAEKLLAALVQVLENHPQYNKPEEDEKHAKSPLARAEIAVDLQRYNAARKILQSENSSQAHYLLGRLDRREGKWATMQEHFDTVNDPELADDIRMEAAYQLWADGDYAQLLATLKDVSEKSNRYTEAQYYSGLALYHQGQKKEALAIWKKVIQACSQDPWIYRADWAYSNVLAEQSGQPRVFSTRGKKNSLLGRIGYMGRTNPDLKHQPHR